MESLYLEIDALIENNQIKSAESKLFKIENKNHQWYYLYSKINFKKQWFLMGKENLEKAIALSPFNKTYLLLLEDIFSKTDNYQNSYKNRRSNLKSLGGGVNLKI